MPDSKDVETYGEGHLAFDCPWCGAISGVDPSRLGESFECPECHDSTRLTEENTRKGHLADAPSDDVEDKAKEKAGHETSEWESYGKDHVTFDCPWCGAISGIDASHIGEHFTCPECHRQTRLTEKNLRKRPVTAPPAEGPRHVERAARRRLLLGVSAVAGVIVLAVLVILLAQRPEDPGEVHAATGNGDESTYTIR